MGALAARGRAGEAFRDYDRLIELAGDSPASYLDTGMTGHRLMDYAMASEDFDPFAGLQLHRRGGASDGEAAGERESAGGAQGGGRRG